MTLHETVEQQIVGRILACAEPERIILFGSRARGDAKPGSDFDLLVIHRSDQPRYRRAGPIYRELAALPVEVDVVVYTPEEVEDWRGVPQAFVTTALREGKVLADITAGWLKKAASDIVAMNASEAAGALDAACFHAQQAAARGPSGS